uniref:Uncharacterized protein n=1 Tax=Romanomermis culicivorax TaxID=13658 RepID=A0A915JRT5_ROMCU
MTHEASSVESKGDVIDAYFDGTTIISSGTTTIISKNHAQKEKSTSSRMGSYAINELEQRHDPKVSSLEINAPAIHVHTTGGCLETMKELETNSSNSLVNELIIGVKTDKQSCTLLSGRLGACSKCSFIHNEYVLNCHSSSVKFSNLNMINLKEDCLKYQLEKQEKL